jgi:chitodextrinase
LGDWRINRKGVGRITSYEWKAWDKAGTRGPCGDWDWGVKERERMIEHHAPG